MNKNTVMENLEPLVSCLKCQFDDYDALKGYILKRSKSVESIYFSLIKAAVKELLV